MAEETKTKVGVDLVKDMIFKWDLGLKTNNEWYIDETNHNPEEMVGPNPSRLLASAILGCLSASFLFCLQLEFIKQTKKGKKIELIYAILCFLYLWNLNINSCYINVFY